MKKYTYLANFITYNCIQNVHFEPFAFFCYGGGGGGGGGILFGWHEA